MEDDHIKREDAWNGIYNCSTKRDEDGYIWVRTIDVAHKIDEIPAADVRPVVRGHYVGEYDGYADGNPVYDMWYCSECGCIFEDWDEKPTYNFCPNCGADMREVTP